MKEIHMFEAIYKMRSHITLLTTITLLTMTHCTIASSMCESKNGFSEKQHEITSTYDYLELNQKYIGNAVKDEFSKIEFNGFTFSSNADGLFVQHENATTATKLNGSPNFVNIFVDKRFNLVYFGTNEGLSVSECGGKTANDISVTNGISIDFGVVDNIGNVYFGNNGDNTKSSEALYVLRKDDQRLIKISGIEQSLGSYTHESISNPNKIAVDTKNNVFVGAYSGHIYLIESGQVTATKLKDIKSNGGVTSVVVDSKDNVYFRTNNALYISKSYEKKLTKIVELNDDFDYFLSVDKNDNLFFQTAYKPYALKSVQVEAVEINKISNSNGFTVRNFTNLQNFHVKNKILYFTSSYNGSDIFLLHPNETTLSQIYTTGDSISSLAIDNSDNVYIVAFSHDLQKLVPFILRKNSNIPIEIRGVTGHLSHVFSDNQNNIFFGSGNGLHVLQNEEVTPFKLQATESQISSFVVDNVYFGTDYDGAFVLKSGELEAFKIDGINTKYGSYVEVFGDRKFDVIYFKTGGALYKLTGGETSVMPVTEGYSPDLYLSSCWHDTYYVQTNEENSSLLSVKMNEAIATHITDIDGQVLHFNSDSFNNLYFVTDKNQLIMLRPSQDTPIILAKDLKFSSLNVDQDDNVYFTVEDGDAYTLRSGEIEAKIIKNIYGKIINFLSNGDDSFFVTAKTANEKGFFLVRNKLQFEAIFHNRHLGEIDNNEDKTIFNILNYLNVEDDYLLSESKNKITNKTPTSATVSAVKGKFKGRFNVTYTIRSKDDENVRNFQLLELLEKAIFFDHANKNAYNFKNSIEIKDVSVATENLKVFPVEIATDSESLSSVEFKNICFNKKKVANTSPLPQTIKVPGCNYETKETILFQITVGLNKTNGSIKESIASVLSSDDEYVILNVNQNVKVEFALSGAFDLSNLNKHSHEINLHNFVENEQEIIVRPKQRILVNYSVRTFVSETNLNLKQKIKGTIVAKISNNKSEETVQITIKEAMQTLRKYNLLPSEISINQENSITFNGRAKLIIKR